MLGRTQNGLNDLSSLSKKDLIKRAEKFSKRYCVGDGKNFKMSDYSTSPELTLTPADKSAAKELLGNGIKKISALQEVLHA